MQGKLIAGINSKVQLYKWIQTDDGSRELQIECSHTGHVLALFVVTRGDFVIVGEDYLIYHIYLPFSGSMQKCCMDRGCLPGFASKVCLCKGTSPGLLVCRTSNSLGTCHWSMRQREPMLVQET